MAEVMLKGPLSDGVVVEVDRSDVPGELVLASKQPHQVAARAAESLETTLDKVGAAGRHYSACCDPLAEVG